MCGSFVLSFISLAASQGTPLAAPGLFHGSQGLGCGVGGWVGERLSGALWWCINGVLRSYLEPEPGGHEGRLEVIFANPRP